MLFEKRRRNRWFTNIIRRWTGRDALAPLETPDAFTPARERLGEVELICLVVRIQNFESLMAQLDLRDLGGEMIKFYGAAAETILRADGDINRFCGASVVGQFNVLNRVEEARIVECAMNLFEDGRAAFDAKLGVQIGVGLCRSLAIAGMFGSMHRITHTAFGPSDICAHHLAEKSASLNICEEFAEHFSRPQIPSEPWIAVEKHWRIEG
jgi:hypothetical protein